MKGNLQNSSSIPSILDLTKLQAQTQRAAQNVNMDGSFELGWGTAVLCAGLVPYLNAILPKSIWASWWTAWIGYLPLICFCFAPYGIPKMIKRFITWPRTGFVADPNDVKLAQLIMLMVFGAALGFSIALSFILVSEVREAMSHPGARSDVNGIIWHGLKLVVCATAAVYLGRKTVTKRQPIPVAYDAALIKQGLGQTVAGRQTLRAVKFTLLLMFIGLPLLVGGAVFGLMYLHKAAMRHTGIHWSQLGMVSFFVATNAILYLMGNAVAIKQHRWKWLGLAAIVFAPVILAPLIPSPAVTSGMIPIFEAFPPLFLSLGLIWFLSGAATLILFIRRNPLPAAETA